jgi:hypothetical protein
MAPLTANRLKPFNPPFTCTGINYFGPLEVVMFRRTVKQYGVLFTCMTTRAVHLEITHSLDTDSFLVAFWRFVNRCGCPSTVYSDNGTNLTAGERILREGMERFDAEKIAEQTSSKGIDWKFSPPPPLRRTLVVYGRGSSVPPKPPSTSTSVTEPSTTKFFIPPSSELKRYSMIVPSLTFPLTLVISKR